MINWQELLIILILIFCYLMIISWMVFNKRKEKGRKMVGDSKLSGEVSNPIRSVLTKHGLEADPELVAKFDEVGGELEDADRHVLEHVLSVVLRDRKYGSLEQRAKKAQSLCSEYILARRNARDTT